MFRRKPLVHRCTALLAALALSATAARPLLACDMPAPADQPAARPGLQQMPDHAPHHAPQHAPHHAEHERQHQAAAEHAATPVPADLPTAPRACEHAMACTAMVVTGAETIRVTYAAPAMRVIALPQSRAESLVRTPEPPPPRA